MNAKEFVEKYEEDVKQSVQFQEKVTDILTTLHKKIESLEKEVDELQESEDEEKKTESEDEEKKTESEDEEKKTESEDEEKKTESEDEEKKTESEDGVDYKTEYEKLLKEVDALKSQLANVQPDAKQENEEQPEEQKENEPEAPMVESKKIPSVKELTTPKLSMREAIKIWEKKFN